MGDNVVMPRPIWTGAISFGLVNVPVKLVAATAPKDVHFHQLHAPDSGRIAQKRVCTLDGQEVPFAEVVKGYEVEPGRYVVLSPSELEALGPQADKTIEIDSFVDLAEIDPLYFERSYYLLPDAKAAKPYALLVEAMAVSSKVALGRFVLRTKQYLVALRATKGALVLSTMFYADEVVEPSELGLGELGVTLSERELSLAQSLIGSMTAPFEPSRYHDAYRERLLELIEAKAKGLPPKTQEPIEPNPAMEDLMAALEASLAEATKRAHAGAAAPK